METVTKDLRNYDYSDCTADELFHAVMDIIEDAFLNKGIRMSSIRVTKQMYGLKFIWIEKRLFDQGVTIKINDE